MLSSKIKYCDVEFGKCNKDLLEEVISYGISLGADFVEIFLENTENSNIIAEDDCITSVSPSFGKGVELEFSKIKEMVL